MAPGDGVWLRATVPVKRTIRRARRFFLTDLVSSEQSVTQWEDQVLHLGKLNPHFSQSNDPWVAPKCEVSGEARQLKRKQRGRKVKSSAVISGYYQPDFLLLIFAFVTPEKELLEMSQIFDVPWYLRVFRRLNVSPTVSRGLVISLVTFTMLHYLSKTSKERVFCALLW